MSCVHLLEYKSKLGLEPYKTILEVFVSNRMPSTAPKKMVMSCFSCGDDLTRLLACMHCVYLACYKIHISEHHRVNGHKLFVELANGCILCNVCKDYVYDPDFDNFTLEKLYKINNVSLLCKWRPSPSDSALLRRHKELIKISPPPREMRGMINLGSTCFMNCTMQVLLHTPMLRDYFFADRHVCHTVKKNECLVCIFIRLFQKYYKDERLTPLYLHEIVYIVWLKARHLSGYGEKDAHEFFMVTLNLLHQASVPKHIGMDACNCIIDRIFHGKMQSDLVCQSCSNVSSTVDPIRDIPLDIPSKSNSTLHECLSLFMRAETLTSEINCSTCNSYQQVTKQLSLNTLPLVIVIQLKRFDNDETLKAQWKKNTFVEFPEELDVTAYMPGQNKRTLSVGNSTDREPTSDNRYSLYAVIEHTGTLDSGHYYAYIRKSSDVWFKCSDDHVARVQLEDVLKRNGYLLFYHKTVLNYTC